MDKTHSTALVLLVLCILGIVFMPLGIFGLIGILILGSLGTTFSKIVAKGIEDEIKAKTESETVGSSAPVQSPVGNSPE